MVKNCRMCIKILECCETREDIDEIMEEKEDCFIPSVTYNQTKKVFDLAIKQIDERDKRYAKILPWS
ncbi:MAG: hypothetical protein ACRCZ0_10975 [Cetobacterium sp.]